MSDTPVDTVKLESLAALSVALVYLEHPEVQATPFAVPAAGPAARVRRAIAFLDASLTEEERRAYATGGGLAPRPDRSEEEAFVEWWARYRRSLGDGGQLEGVDPEDRVPEHDATWAAWMFRAIRAAAEDLARLEDEADEEQPSDDLAFDIALAGLSERLDARLADKLATALAPHLKDGALEEVRMLLEATIAGWWDPEGSRIDAPAGTEKRP